MVRQRGNEHEGGHLVSVGGVESREVVRLPGARLQLSMPTPISYIAHRRLRGGQRVDVTVSLAVDAEAMRYRLMSVRLDAVDDELDADALRAVRLADVVSEAIAAAAKTIVTDDDGTPTVHLGDSTLSLHEEVARHWLVARFLGEQPNQYIARQLGITAPAAAQRVARARQAGLIPPAAGPGARK